ncbi:hypothetical protein HJ088_15495 [Vibrio parahaemolyticus]|jgi:hypothetical protein|uniref:hypothetical protein n=1 Tax=Vibrio harveyi group TaxID=717610 RepID=UPI001303C725|nr:MULTISPECIES: hypothetical protein [Vibrio harveyi group]EHK7587247.1 hypothetical protein [Vibrio parahaemolyticus]EHZ2573882.1 hypothetical protein [Vibrio parahaemolyticus]MBE4199116.1 hypothetical protein [Vibrio parahaemolyticus]MBE5126540.1 hypothetical protein [Vibrio parahaemolyticus]MCX8827921.1 hypothetical protein [Vibrio parahaemolyticus]
MNFLTGIVGKTLLEVLKGLFFQIGWSIILERFATRLVVWGLETLKGLSTNDVLQETVDDIINALQGKRLKEIPQKE